MNKLLILLVLSALACAGSALAQGEPDRVEAPSALQESIDDDSDMKAGPDFEADAAEVQAEQVEKTGSAKGLSRHASQEVEEIVVSARKRAELLEDTPLSVTALSATTLRESGVTRIDQVQQLVPNMTFQPGFVSGGTPQIRIRGVGTSATGPAFDSGVGLYLDGVFFSRSPGALIDVVDVQQVEVLRGPQGTLFGMSTVGGAVNMTTVKPSTEGVEGSVLIRPGNFGTVTTRATINTPIGSGGLEEKLATRLSFGSGQSSGYVYNSFRDQQVSNNTSLTFLGSVRYMPIEDLTIDVSGSYSKVTNSGLGGQCKFMQDGSLTSLVPGYEEACKESSPFEARSNLAQLGNFGNYGTWGVIEYDVGELSVFEDIALKSLTAWRAQDVRTRTDLDGTRIDVVDLKQAGNGINRSDGTPGSAHQIQQELQLNASTWDGKVNFVSGFFSFWEKAEAGNTVLVVPLSQSTNSNIFVDNFNWALYTQGTADVTEWLSLTGGVRYNTDNKGINQINRNTNNPLAPSGGGSGEKTFESWTPMGSVALLAPADWIDGTPLDHIMTYFTYSKGFKGGGFNATTQASVASTTPTPFDPETLNNYEVGVKTIGFEQMLSLNLAAFRGKYDDIQVTAQKTFVDSTGETIIQRLTLNAAQATIQGVEIELASRPIEGLSITGSMGFLDAIYDEFPDALSDLTGQAIDRSGQSLNLSPRWQTFLGAQYSFPLELSDKAPTWLEGWLTPRLEWAYRGRNHVLGPEALPSIQSGYNLLNARFSYDFMDDQAQVALWAQNLLNEAYFMDVFGLGGTFGSLQRFYQAPRTFGAEVSYRF